MTRVEVAAEINARIGFWLVETEITAADTTGNLKEPLDDALAAMGVAQEDRATAEPADGDRFILEAEYHTLRKVVRVLALRFNVGLGGNSFQLRQLFENAKVMLDDAELRLREATGVWVGSLDLAFTDSVAVDEFGAAAS